MGLDGDLVGLIVAEGNTDRLEFLVEKHGAIWILGGRKPEDISCPECGQRNHSYAIQTYEYGVSRQKEYGYRVRFTCNVCGCIFSTPEKRESGEPTKTKEVEEIEKRPEPQRPDLEI